MCLDCDCLTVEQSCPWCDREGTVPLSAWFRPIEPGRAKATRQAEPDPAPSHRWVLIVQHHQRDLYRVLRQALTGTVVEVLYERRVGQRRRTAAALSGDERRRTDRRRPQATAIVYPGSPAGPTRESSLRREVGRDAVEVVRPRRRQTAPA